MHVRSKRGHTAQVLSVRLVVGCLLSIALLPCPSPTFAGSLPSVVSAIPPTRHAALPEALVAFGIASDSDAFKLRTALDAYQASGKPERVEPIVSYLQANPTSPWRQSLQLNLGKIYYHHGYFSLALKAWDTAWRDSRNFTEANRKAVADDAFGELIRMHARLGHAEELRDLLDSVGNRPLSGAATEAVQGAREGLWKMTNEPGVAYLCGPMALKSLAQQLSGNQAAVETLDRTRSGPRGVSLAEVSSLAEKTGLPYRPMYRTAGTSIPVPAVVHWKVNHYAAIVSKQGDLYRVMDPTFGDEHWLSAAAINAETSGYFLASYSPADSSWRGVTAREATNVRGMGYTSSINPDASRDYDDKDCCANKSKGMATYSVHSALVSLNIQDTPVGYMPPRGPAVEFNVSYNQREANQPATFIFSNLGQKWSHNWMGYIVDDPTVPGANVALAVPKGGTERYSGYNAGTGTFAVESRLGAQLVRTTASPITYERRFNDGSVQVYSKSDGAAFYPRRVFLTAVRDPAGNQVTLGYDASLRLTSVTDAIGQVSTLSYSDVANPLRITRFTDPFGRYASFLYDPNGAINQITDAVGMLSSFHYDAAGLIDVMTTPYGSTTFSYTGTGTTRTLHAIDPLGYAERFESLHQAPGIPFTESVVPAGMNVFNQYIDGRNSFYWDKDAWAAYPGDYTKAVIKHWLHTAGNTAVTSSVLESTKRPTENRVWLNYPGQSSPYHSTGTSDNPSLIGRVLDDGTTQLIVREYNVFGLPTRSVDALGREEVYEYFPNNVDLMRVKRKNGASYDVLAQYTYNSQHLPLTYTDDAGQTTTYTYNAAGQMTTISNPLSQVVTYEYDANGFLQRIKNPNNSVQRSFTYDAVGRIATETDSEGYVLTYTYDNLDRLWQVIYPDATHTAETYIYDKLDLWSYTNRTGQVTSFTHNALGQLTQMKQPVARFVNYEWSRAGRPTAMLDGESRPIRWEYNANGKVSAEVYADTTRKTYGYDSAGRLLTETDALNQIKTYAYAKDNSIVGLSYANAVNPTASVTYSYDPVHPRMTSMTDGLGTTTFAYGAIGAPGAQQLIRDDGPFASNDVVAYTYDVLGRRASRVIGATYSGGVLSGGQTETIGYDAIGRISSKTNPLGTFAFAYLGQSDQLTSQTVAPSGTLKTPAMLLTYETNAKDRRIKQIRYASSPTALPSELLQDYNYTFNTLGLITKIEEFSYGTGGAVTAHKKWDLVHDTLRRVKTYAPATGSDAGTSWYEYEYDKADNRTAASLNGTNQTLNFNSLNQATNLGPYDAAGRFIGDTGPLSQGNKWDAENRLVLLNTISSNDITFVYDGLGRRLRKTVAGFNGQKNRYLWCDDQICEQRSGSTDANLDATFFSEGAKVGAVQHIYFKDQLGTNRQFRPRGTQTIGMLEFGPYGERVSNSGGGLSMGYQFANMFVEGTSNYLYMTRYRTYNPKTNQWWSRDPIGVLGGVNLYNYVASSPFALVDPLGLEDTSENPKGQDSERLVHGASAGIGLRDAYQAQKDARGAAVLLPGKSTGPGGALRHCTWQCLLTEKFGPAKAKGSGDLHEAYGILRHDPADDRKMDYANNIVGRRCGLMDDGRSCQSRCMHEYFRGHLFGLGGRPLPPPY